MISTDIRELRNNLSHYVRQIEAGKRIAVTAHGRVVAELVPPATGTRARSSRYDEFIAAGIIEPAASPMRVLRSGRTSACRLALLPS